MQTETVCVLVSPDALRWAYAISPGSVLSNPGYHLQYTRTGNTMQPSLYSQTFCEDDFYVVCLSWLAADLKTTHLDCCDLLLYHTYDGQVIYDPDLPENWAQQDDEGASLRKLFGRQTYSKSRAALFDHGLLCRYSKPARHDKMTQKMWRELTQGIKYAWTDWPPPKPWLFRPRSYIEQRWPVWLGRPDCGSRLVLITLLAHWQKRSEGSPANACFSISFSEIFEFVEAVFGDQAEGQSQTAKLRKGIGELRTLGLIDDGEDFDTWDFDPARLAAGPGWPVEPVAEALRLNSERHRPQIELIREFMLTCCEPVTRLAQVRKAIEQDYRAWIFSDVEVDILRDHLRSRRKNGPLLTLDQIMEDFKRKTARQGTPVGGPTFSFALRPAAIIDQDVDGNPLAMPIKSDYALNATQIRVVCDFSADTPLSRIRETLAALEFYIWQAVDDGSVKLIPVPVPQLSEKRIKYGFTLQANNLHGRLDYSRPFKVLIRSTTPHPRLGLTCTIRLLREEGGR